MQLLLDAGVTNTYHRAQILDARDQALTVIYLGPHAPGPAVGGAYAPQLAAGGGAGGAGGQPVPVSVASAALPVSVDGIYALPLAPNGPAAAVMAEQRRLLADATRLSHQDTALQQAIRASLTDVGAAAPSAGGNGPPAGGSPARAAPPRVAAASDVVARQQQQQLLAIATRFAAVQDDALAEAIAASLAEAEAAKQRAPADAAASEEEERRLRLAIEASLKDMHFFAHDLRSVDGQPVADANAAAASSSASLAAPVTGPPQYYYGATSAAAGAEAAPLAGLAINRQYEPPAARHCPPPFDLANLPAPAAGAAVLHGAVLRPQLDAPLPPLVYPPAAASAAAAASGAAPAEGAQYGLKEASGPSLHAAAADVAYGKAGGLLDESSGHHWQLAPADGIGSKYQNGD